MVTGAYLKPSTILSHVSPRDKQIKYEAEEKAKISGLPTAKELRGAKQVADARLRREEEEAQKAGLVSVGSMEVTKAQSKSRNARQATDLFIEVGSGN